MPDREMVEPDKQADAWGSYFVTRRYKYIGNVDLGEERSFDRVLPDVRGGSVLDIGIGAGRTSAILAPHAGDYVGVDFSANMIKLARKLHPNLDFRVGDARHLNAFHGETFDVVVFSF